MCRFATWLAAVGLSVGMATAASAQPAPRFLHKSAEEWAVQLKSPNAAMRRSAAFALGQLGNFAVLRLPDLKRALAQEKDPRALESIVRAMGEVAAGTESGDPELQTILVRALDNPDKLVRRSAACSLGSVGNKSDVTRMALAKALRDTAQEVRQNAAWALGQLDEKAAPVLVAALGDASADAFVKRDAANALFAIGKANPEIMRPALDALLGMCRDADPEVRKAALVPLIKIVGRNDALALPVLKSVLRDDPDPEVRRYSALALSNVGGKDAAEAVPLLVDALQNGEPHLKRSAAVALHNIGEVAAPAIPALSKLLQHPDADLRKAAALALGGIGSEAADAVPALVQILTDPKQPLEVRVEAAEALTGMKDIPAVQRQMPALLSVLGNRNEDGDLRVRLAWLFNDFVRDRATMEAAKPVMASVCAEPPTKDNGSARYHCAFVLSVVFRAQVPEPAFNVLTEWLQDSAGRLYGKKLSSVGAVGTETTGQAAVRPVLEGDSRVMAVDALRLIGPARVREHPEVVRQLRTLAADNATFPELRSETKKLLAMLE